MLRLEEVYLLHSILWLCSIPCTQISQSVWLCRRHPMPNIVQCTDAPDCLANRCSCISDMAGSLLVTSCCVLRCPEALLCADPEQHVSIDLWLLLLLVGLGAKRSEAVHKLLRKKFTEGHVDNSWLDKAVIGHQVCSSTAKHPCCCCILPALFFTICCR